MTPPAPPPAPNGFKLLVHNNAPVISVPATGRSVKAESPPTFTSDKPTNGNPKVKFKPWMMLLKAKLKKNADHFADDEEKIDYIAGKLGGTAQEALIPWITPNARGELLLTTCQEVLNHLEEHYNDPNEYETARLEYRELGMETSDRFAAFRIEFTRLASQAGIHKSEMKRDLHDKLPKRLNEPLVEKSQDNNMTYEQYCKAAMTLDYQQNKNFLAAQAERREKVAFKPSPPVPYTQPIQPAQNITQYRPPQNRFPRNHLPTINPPGEISHYGIRVRGTATDGHPIYHRPSAEQIKLLLARGQCFTCHEFGHRTPECKYKDELGRMNAIRINEIAAQCSPKESKDAAQAN